MTPDLAALLDELEAFGTDHDDRATEHASKMLNITHDTGQFLDMLIRIQQPRRILEVGTSNGYSTIWLAAAARACGALVDTIERNPAKIALARANFRRARVADVITQVEEEASSVLSAAATGTYDWIFLDSNRTQYAAWWPDLRRILTPGGLIVCDNATSHPHEFVEFREAVDRTSGVTTLLVPIGKGELLILEVGQGRSRFPIPNPPAFS